MTEFFRYYSLTTVLSEGKVTSRTAEYGNNSNKSPQMGHRVAIQTAETKFSASFLLWGQRQRHTNTDMGGLDCKFADNSSVKKHQEALCIFAGCYHGTTYAYVLRRFYRIHGKSREDLE